MKKEGKKGRGGGHGRENDEKNDESCHLSVCLGHGRDWARMDDGTDDGTDRWMD
jgi:hypothetical protein